MDRPEYMWIPIKYIPQEIIDEYDVNKFIKDGYIYVEIVKGMYGLKQAGIIANQLLEKYFRSTDLLQPFTPMDYGDMRHVQFNVH